MDSETIIKNTDVQKIANEGAKIYQKIKSEYDPKSIGKFLAIDTDSKDIYLADTSANAVLKAREEHPNKIFYVVKIGFDVAETMARSFTHNR